MFNDAQKFEELTTTFDPAPVCSPEKALFLKAYEIIQKRWCRGNFCLVRDGLISHCTIGAILVADGFPSKHLTKLQSIRLPNRTSQTALNIIAAFNRHLKSTKRGPRSIVRIYNTNDTGLKETVDMWYSVGKQEGWL